MSKKELFRRLAQAYEERQVAKAEAFVKEVFVHKDPLVIGTGDHEWCLSHEEIVELFASDWEYWGQVTLLEETLHTIDMSSGAYFEIKATLHYEFDDAPETYKRYGDTVKDFMKDTSLTMEERAATSAFLLCHKFYPSKEEKRGYEWPLILSGLLVKEGQGWKFAMMQFSLPIHSVMPDEHYTALEAYQKAYEHLQEKMRPLTVQNFEGLRRHDQVYLPAWKEAALHVGPHGLKRTYGSNSVVMRPAYRQGSFKSGRDLPEIFDNHEATLDHKEGLYQLQRALLTYQLGLAKGTEAFWPVRLLEVYDEEKPVIRQESSPFHWILEGKY